MENESFSTVQCWGGICLCSGMITAISAFYANSTVWEIIFFYFWWKCPYHNEVNRCFVVYSAFLFIFLTLSLFLFKILKWHSALASKILEVLCCFMLILLTVLLVMSFSTQVPWAQRKSCQLNGKNNWLLTHQVQMSILARYTPSYKIYFVYLLS